MNRTDFQELAEVHPQNAKALLDARLYAGAYYMSGYVVECALKSCICKSTSQFDFYPHPKEARDAWTHEFAKLIGLADVGTKIAYDRGADNKLKLHWNTAEAWSENSRYEPRSKKEAEDRIEAVSDPVHGVLACIRRYW